MTPRPRITAAILCYNYGHYLAGAIESCLAQGLPEDEYEIVVFDDGSTDSTPEVCERYHDRVRTSRTENQGFATTLARAVNESHGEFVAFLDADDLWDAGKLREVSKHLDEGALFVAHPMRHIDSQGDVIPRPDGACGNTSSIVVHRLAAQTLLPGTSELFCHPVGDLCKSARLKSALGSYRIHDLSMTDRSATSAHTEFFARTNHVVADRLLELAEAPPFWCGDAKRIRQLAGYYRSEGDFKDFQRRTELRQFLPSLRAGLKAATSYARACRLPGVREARPFGRVLKNLLTKA